MEKAWVVGGSSDMVWLVGTRLLVARGVAEPIEGRSRHFQQLEEAMMTVLSFGLVDCVGLGRLSRPRGPVKVVGHVESSDAVGLIWGGGVDAELKKF